MPNSQVRRSRLTSLKSKTKQLMDEIAQQEFHVVGFANMHTAIIPEKGTKSLPASLADAVTSMKPYLEPADRLENIELFEVQKDAEEIKYARALAQFVAILHVAIETNHAARHLETQKFYEKCVKQILEEPLLRKGGKYHKEFTEIYEDSLMERRKKRINPQYLQTIHIVEIVFKSLTNIEDHLEEYISDIEFNEDPAKYFLSTSAKQILLCRSEEEINECVSDFKFSLKHSGLTEAQQKQLTSDIENYAGNYKSIFQADRRHIKLIGAALLQVGALGVNVAAFLTMPEVSSELTTIENIGAKSLANNLQQDAIKEFSNIRSTPQKLTSYNRQLVDLLAPYLLDSDKSLGEKIIDDILKFILDQWQTLAETTEKQFLLAATAVSATAFAVPPLAPILLPTAGCLALTSAALTANKSLSDIWITDKLISEECDSNKASYERDFNIMMQACGTPEEIAENQQRVDRYRKSNKPDLELSEIVEGKVVANKAAPSQSRYSLFKSQTGSDTLIQEEDVANTKLEPPTEI